MVTDRGRPVAELRPIAKAEDDEEALLQELAALGKVRLPSGTPFPPFRPIRLPGPSVSQALSQAIREDRDAGY